MFEAMIKTLEEHMNNQEQNLILSLSPLSLSSKHQS